MDETEILEQRYRFFTEKGVQIAIDYSKTLTTLFTAIIAGLIALVTYQEVGFRPVCSSWSPTFWRSSGWRIACSTCRCRRSS